MPKKKSTPDSYDPRVQGKAEFLQIIRRIENSGYSHDAFRDWCEMAYCAWAKLTEQQRNTDAANRLEARYMEIVGKYPKEVIREDFQKLASLAQEAVEAGGCDFLGEIASELSVLNDAQGQFFTPYHVCRMMATMMLGDVKGQIAAKGYLSVGEPASGAGAMILAVADEVEAQGFPIYETLLVQATDLNPIAYWMCFLQLGWRGVPAHCFHGNTLSDEMFEDAWTVTSLWFHSKHGHLGLSEKGRAGQDREDEGTTVPISDALPVPPPPPVLSSTQNEKPTQLTLW